MPLNPIACPAPTLSAALSAKAVVLIPHSYSSMLPSHSLRRFPASVYSPSRARSESTSNLWSA
jgi:hypothetical protein